MKLLLLFAFICTAFKIYPQWNLAYPPITDKSITKIVTNDGEDWFACEGGTILKRSAAGVYDLTLIFNL